MSTDVFAELCSHLQMAYVILHPDDIIATADIDYIFKLRLDLAENILADESTFDSCAALNKLRRLDQRLSELSSPETRPSSLDYVHRLEILHCLEKKKAHKLITYEDVRLNITTVQIAFDDFVRWHPLDRHEEADKILAVAAKICLARTSRDALCRLDIKADTTDELLSTIRKYFPSPKLQF
jgi:hypothetical protein